MSGKAVYCAGGQVITRHDYSQPGHPRRVHADGSLCDHDGPVRIGDASQVTRQGPSITDCLEAAMRADPSLTIEEAIRTVPISEETLRRYARDKQAGEGDA